MPFKRIPNTVTTRLNALRAARDKVLNTDESLWAISSASNDKLQTVLINFEREVAEKGTALTMQGTSTAEKYVLLDKTRLFSSHFLQVFNFGVERGKYPAEHRPFYGLDINQSELPPMVTEDEIVNAARNIISGDERRVLAGGAAMTNPTALEIDDILGSLLNKQSEQSGLKDNYDKHQEDVEKMLPEVDELIRDMWDEIEFHFRKDDEASKRRKAREWGVVYVSRPGEEPEEEEPEVPEQPEPTV